MLASVTTTEAYEWLAPLSTVDLPNDSKKRKQEDK